MKRVRAARDRIAFEVRYQRPEGKPHMRDTYRRYRAIARCLLQRYPRACGHERRHLHTLTLLICGIVGAQHAQLPKIVLPEPAFCTPCGATKLNSRSFRSLGSRLVASGVAVSVSWWMVIGGSSDRRLGQYR